MPYLLWPQRMKQSISREDGVRFLVTSSVPSQAHMSIISIPTRCILHFYLLNGCPWFFFHLVVFCFALLLTSVIEKALEWWVLFSPLNETEELPWALVAAQSSAGLCTVTWPGHLNSKPHSSCTYMAFSCYVPVFFTALCTTTVSGPAGWERWEMFL